MRRNTRRKCIWVRINTAERKRERMKRRRIILEQETKERRNKMNKMEVDGERTKKIYLSLRVTIDTRERW